MDEEAKGPRDGLSPFERGLLAGKFSDFGVTNPATMDRWQALILLAQHQDLKAVALLRRSRNDFAEGSLERAISERLYGLALIRVQREVEGTFALERADAVLELHGLAGFGLEP